MYKYAYSILARNSNAGKNHLVCPAAYRFVLFFFMCLGVVSYMFYFNTHPDGTSQDFKVYDSKSSNTSMYSYMEIQFLFPKNCCEAEKLTK